MTRAVPYIPKKAITIIVIGASFEAGALRQVLENFNYRVTVHWTGSRKECLMLLGGDIPVSDDLVILSCHGIESGIDVPGEEAIGPQDIGKTAKLQGKTILNLGCKTGSPSFREAFRQAGVAHYVAPDDYPEASAVMIFAVNLFYRLSTGESLHEAVEQASSLSDEVGQFKLV